MSAEAALQKVPLFSQLSQVDLQRVMEVARERAYPKNSVILFEDDPGDALYVVKQGQVKVVLIGEDGREVILGVLGVGEYFGELSLIDDRPRSAHVIAIDAVTCLVFSPAAPTIKSVASSCSMCPVASPVSYWTLLKRAARTRLRKPSRIKRSPR